MKVLNFICCLFLSGMCFSQKNDYVIKVNGDTIWGKISLKNKVFHIAGADEADINASDVIKIKSSNYKGSAVVQCRLQLYSDNLDEIELDFIRKGYIDTVMILDEILATPKINLYYGVNNYKTPFYFYKTPADSFPVQLVVRYFLQGGLANYTNDRPRYRGDLSRVNIVEDKGYVNQLHAIMGNCKNISETMWELLTYRDYSLKKVIKKYNKCK